MCMGASTLRLGAVLMQCSERGKYHVIAFASHTLNSAEANYSISHLRTLAVVWGLKNFCDIILGYKITVYTDHTAITELVKGENLASLHNSILPYKNFHPSSNIYTRTLKCSCTRVTTKHTSGGSEQHTPCNQLLTSGSGYCTKKAWHLGRGYLCLRI